MRYIALSIITIVLSGCVSRKSVGKNPEYKELIGQRYKTTTDLFLVENTEYFSLVSEGSIQPGPTFDQFRNGEWKNQWNRPEKYLHILPKGAILETADVIRQDHVEMGRTWEVHGVILDPSRFSEYGPIYMCYFTTLENLIWQHGIDKIDTQPSDGENVSRPTP